VGRLSSGPLRGRAMIRKRHGGRHGTARSRAGNGTGRATQSQATADQQLVRRYLIARSTRLLANTRAAYAADLSDLARALGRTGLLGAASEDLAAYLFDRIRDPKDPDDPRPWSRRSGRRKLTAISGFYKWAARDGLVVKNPADGIEIARSERPAPVRVPSGDTASLFAHFEERVAGAPVHLRAYFVLHAAIFRLCYNLALRISEASDLRFSRMRNVAGERFVEIVKKGDKVKLYPLAGVVAEALDRWLVLRASITAEPLHADFVFVHPDTGRRVSRKRAWDRIRKAARRVGLPADLVAKMSPHKLRHARAYHLLKEGKDLATVQAILDHSNISTTSVYVEDDEAARLQALRDSSELPVS
jgi:site-specific recombinase XerD